MNNKITFPRLATMLADRSGRSKRFSEDFLREFFALISETLESQESVKIKGLGTFRLTRVEPRRSVDVTTGEPMEISGHTKVVFTPSKELAEAVNAPFEAFSAIEISDDADISQLFNEDEIEGKNEFDDEEGVFDADITSSFEPTIEIHPEENVISFGNTVADTIAEKEANHPIEDVDLIIQSESQPDFQPESKSATQSEPQPEPRSEFQFKHQEEAQPEPKPESQPVPKPDFQSEPYDADPSQKDDISSEIYEEIEEFEVENSRRRNWVRGLLIALGAAVVALFATFIIWYVVATNDFNRFFSRSAAPTPDEHIEGFVVGKKTAEAAEASPSPAPAIDSLADSIQENQLEEEVPTAPSDVVVYDTISTTRYLTTMAKAHYGNYNLWPYIYEENQSFLGHPDRIRPGTPVVIPKLSKYGVDPTNSDDIEKAKKLGVEIYARYGKKI